MWTFVDKNTPLRDWFLFGNANKRSLSSNLIYPRSPLVFFQVNPCKATVIQRADGELVLGRHEHNHQGQVGAGLAAKITAKTKAEAKKNLFKPAMVIVNEVLMEEITDAPCPSLPKPVNLAKAANYMRQRLRPLDPKSLDFELDEDHLPEGFLRRDVQVKLMTCNFYHELKLYLKFLLKLWRLWDHLPQTIQFQSRIIQRFFVFCVWNNQLMRLTRSPSPSNSISKSFNHSIIFLLGAWSSSSSICHRWAATYTFASQNLVRGRYIQALQGPIYAVTNDQRLRQERGTCKTNTPGICINVREKEERL